MSIVLENLTKRYDGHPVVNHVSLEVGDGEFFVLLGSSGSGKSTILGMIAGLVAVDQGRVWLHGRDVTELPAQLRRVGFVFQNYALFQHMTVADNIEFGLRVRKVATAERRRRRDELLELVGLAGLGNRLPRQISGGQQQRVALARALAHQPEVLLLDEPLGALDARIRTELRRTLRAVQQELGITTIFVTHDQEEAFELADRIGVMNFGRLLEVGVPEELYQRPQTEFVATFLGTANLLVGQSAQDGVHLGPRYFPLLTKPGDGWLDGRSGGRADRGIRRVQVLFRPEDVNLAPTAQELESQALGVGEVEQTLFVGSFERLRLRLSPLPGVRAISPPVPYGSDSILVDAVRPRDQAERFPLQPGHRSWVGVRRIHALTHPGLSFLIVSDGSLRSQAALALGGHIARAANARVTLLGQGMDGAELDAFHQTAKEQLGSGLASLEARSAAGPIAEIVAEEVERQPYDLIVIAYNRHEGLEPAEQILQSGDHHLLLVPRPQPIPSRALVCVASGEPGKEDVLFAGRLIRHIGAEATLLYVTADGASQDAIERERIERFLERGVRTMELLGVTARMAVRAGAVIDQVAAEVDATEQDLLVMGAPLEDRDGNIPLSGVIGQVLNRVNRPMLIVRSTAYARQDPVPTIRGGRIHQTSAAEAAL